MFGYIKPMTAELKVREHELYRSIYCGLCASMGENICHSQRFTLSYDIVFLALVRIALTDEKVHINKKRCIIHPFKARNRAFIPETLKYCSQAASVLTYFNITDDITDTKGIKKAKHKLLLPWAKRFVKKAGVPDMKEKCKEYLIRLSELEGINASLDACADSFGKMLSYIFGYGLEDNEFYNEISTMGYHCGVWIYIMDAADDIAKDKENDEFNPLARYEAFPDEMLKVAATLHLADMKKAFDTIRVNNHVIKDIIDNILTLGMPEMQDKIIKEK